MIRGGHALAYVTDMSRALRFWIEVMGAKLVSESPHFAMLDLGGIRLGLHPPSPEAPPPGTRGALGLGLEVDDFESAVAVYENRGIAFRVVVTPHVKLAYFSDPDGNGFYLTSRAG